MRATDQLAAMEMMAVDPVRRVVVPRFLGGVISMPLLAAIFSMVGIFGAQLVGVQLMGVDRRAVLVADARGGRVRRRHGGRGEELRVRGHLQPGRGL